MLVEAGSRNNKIDYTTWTAGTSGSESGFSRNGSDSENYRVIDDGPQGSDIVVWESRPDSSSGPDGGWNCDYFSIDNTKLHRFSVWIRRTVIGSGTAYFGTNGGGSAVLRRSSGSEENNPYFWSGVWGYPAGEWVLLVGHVWPVGSGTGSDHPDSGSYTVKDGRVANIGTDFVCASGTTSLRLRTYLYYSTNTSTRQQFCYPRVDVCDGTEPSISDLLHGLDERWETSGFPDGLSVQNNSTVSGRVSELGIADGMVAWLPLKHDDRNLCNNDLSSGGHDGTFLFSSGQVGANFDGTDYNDIVFYPTVNVNSGDEWTMMCWVYLRQFNNNNYPIFMSSSLPYLAVNSSGGQLRCSYSDGGQANATSSKSLNANQWYHVCATFKAGDGVRLYCDSVQVAHRTSPTSTSSIDFVRLGGHQSTSYKVDGIVGDSKVFNRSLSAEEIAVEYKRSGPTKMTHYNGGVYIQGQLKEVSA